MCIRDRANPAKEMDGRKIGGLEGIFGPKDGWTNKAKMPDNIITSFVTFNLTLLPYTRDRLPRLFRFRCV